jgi:hypothetical protein
MKLRIVLQTLLTGTCGVAVSARFNSTGSALMVDPFDQPANSGYSVDRFFMLRVAF